MRPKLLGFALIVFLVRATAAAAIFGIVSVTVEDPQHRPIPNADVTLTARLSSWRQHAQTGADGQLSFPAVPAGEYVLSVKKDGFQTAEQPVVVRSGTVNSATVALPLGEVSETVTVTGAAAQVNTRSVTTQSLVTRDAIDSTPGALRTNSLDMVTQFVPGSYMVHDQLHVRGGHQVSWLVDGVPVPNTNIASNVGPQFDPKDIDTIEIQRGGYSAEFGDRTYGVFNVVTRSGFERSREAELVANYGTYRETNDQFSLGDHGERWAYYASVNANRTDLGLETPVPENIHNQAAGVGGFVSFISSSSPTDQFRVVGSLRGDQYEIPNSPDDQAAGIDDHQHERDAFVNVSWLRTIGSNAFLTVSPFYNYNRAAIDGGPIVPIVSTDHRSSHYIGAQAVLAASHGPHTARAGAYFFHQSDDVLFGLQSGDAPALTQTQAPTGHVEVVFAEDQYAVRDWLTLTGGVRITHFSGLLTENAVDPRVGAVVRVTPWGWAVRGSYGRYYQPPPLTTVNGPLLDLAAEQGFGFLPLKGERDAQYEIGVAIPMRGWTIDTSLFRTNAENYFDHDVVGNSNIFIPLTIEAARIRGFEATLRSPRVRRASLGDKGPWSAQAHLAYSHQYAEGRGAVTGGLTSFAPPQDEYFFLDHDQRDTLTAGVDVGMPAGMLASATIGYGSGFLEGNGPGHLPSHAVVNLQGTKTFGTQWTVIVTALNVGDTHFLLDESNTFGGTHYNSPRQISAGIRYRFHY